MQFIKCRALAQSAYSASWKTLRKPLGRWNKINDEEDKLANERIGNMLVIGRQLGLNYTALGLNYTALSLNYTALRFIVMNLLDKVISPGEIDEDDLIPKPQASS